MLRALVPFVFALLVLCRGTALHAQNDLASVLTLDEVVINAGFDSAMISEFIYRVRSDTTFYKAFLNLKYFPHRKEGEVQVYNKNETQRGTMKRRAVQHLDPAERMWVEVTYETTNGKIRKKNGEWKYLTAEMYDEVFFPASPQRVSNRIVNSEQELVSGSKIDKHKAQLKRLMFNPGAEIGNVPFIGDKMAIFDNHMVPYYDYALYMDSCGPKPCLAFTCRTKPGMEKYTVIQDLTSYFDLETYEVLARDYSLVHSTILFDFDIRMQVVNKQENGWLLPEKVWYDGYWNVPFKKPEILQFEMRCSDYDTSVGRYRSNPAQK